MTTDPETPTARAVDVRFLLSRPQNMVALSLGAGLSPVWPGTVGSLLGFPLFWLLSDLTFPARALAYVGLFVLGAWACHSAGSALGQQDHRAIVWDETVGLSLTLECLPATVTFWIGGFVLFRIIDAAKPWPVNLAHNARPNGFMVMFDDVLAAAYAGIILLIAGWAVGVG